jgi:tetratricopeptide (TPR) repeat protein
VNTDALIKKASDAINAQNYDYAIELLFDLIRREPTNAKARQTLWTAEKRKLGDAKPSPMQALGPQVSAFIHALMGKRPEIITDCERILLVDPNNVKVRNKLGKAADELGNKEIAMAAYESSRESDPKDIEALRQLGRLYRERFEGAKDRRDLELALQRYEQLLQVKSTDAEARNAAQALAALRATIDGGWDTTETYRDVIKDQDAAKQSERGLDRLVQLEDDIQTEINSVLKAVEKEPDRSSLRIKLGDLYMQKKRFKSAKEAYLEAQKLDHTNTLIRAKLGDVQINFMEMRMEQLRAKPDDPVAKKELAELEAKSKDFRITEFRQRVQDQPTNMEFHFALGRMLYDDGDVDGAVAMFQRTINDPRYRMIANQMIGRCLVTKGMFDRAITTFARALEGSSVMNETVKALYYDLGLTYEKVEDWKNAEHAYGKIYESEIGYRDVAQKMDYVYKKAREQSEKTEG